MAYINCPRCNKSVSQYISHCPFCGYTIKHSNSKHRKVIGVTLGFLLIIIIILVIRINHKVINSSSNKKLENPTYHQKKTVTNSTSNVKPETSTNYQEKAKKKWYEGGTLHKATIAEWRIATDENKLATCSDFIAKIRLDNGVAYNEMEIMAEAYALKKCIDEAQKGVDISSWKVSEVAAICLVELGYK